MSIMALVNQDGTIKKLFRSSSIPKDYRTSEDEMLFWRMNIIQCSFLSNFRKNRPTESDFYFDSAHGQIFFEKIKDKHNPSNVFCRDKFEIIVKGKNVSDVEKIRDHILHLIQSHETWDSINKLD